MAIMKGWRRKRDEGLEAAAAAFLEETSTPAPSSRLKDYSLQRIMAKAEAGEGAGEADLKGRGAYRSPALARHVILVALTILLVLVFSTTGAYAFSRSALPDSPLYATKIFFERARVALTPSTSEDIRLEMGYSDRRLDELKRMVASGNQRGADRWLREYLRNIEGAGILLDQASGEDAEVTALQFLEILDRQATTLDEIIYSSPAGLFMPVEEAYRGCNREREHMNQRCGGGCMETPSSPGKTPGEGQDGHVPNQGSGQGPDQGPDGKGNGYMENP